MFYRFFESKEEAMQALGDRMFLQNNPFEAVKGRTDLNGLQKIRELLNMNRSDEERNLINVQAVSILEDPRILAAAIEANRRVLTPLWFELIEEGQKDGSVRTEYAKELSEMLPLINFWFMPSVFPASAEEIRRKYRFVMEVLSRMGLPILDDEAAAFAETVFNEIAETKSGSRTETE